MSQSSNDLSAGTVYLRRDIVFSTDGSSSSINIANRKRSSCKKHVTFAGIDPSVAEKKGKEAGDRSRKSWNSKSSRGKRRVRKDVAYMAAIA